MKINIIGGNGLVGNGIASALAKNHDIRVFGSSDFDRSTLKFKTSDVFDCDLFIHAAGITDEQVSNDYDHAVFKSNDFIRYIVDGLGKTGCSQIVYISTIHVFGNLNRDLCEKTFCSPLSKYSELHHKTERLFEKLIGKYSMNYLTLRVPTIYGFPKDKSRITRPDIIQYAFPISVKNNNSITLKSSGEQYRLFTSNLKVGEIITKWLDDPLKDRITVDVVQGKNITVKNFANLCLEKYNALKLTNPNLVIDADVKTDTSKSHKKIMVIPRYDCEEIYTVQQFLDDFFLFYS